MKYRVVAVAPIVAALAWAHGAQAQQHANPVVGWLNPQHLGTSQHLFDGFRAGLREAGFIEGKNVTIAVRTGGGDRGRLPALADDLVRQGVAAIMAGSPPAALAAKRATGTIPIVFTSGADPVRIGLVSSFNRPAGNATGVHIQFSQVVGKRLTLLHETVPKARRYAVLVNPRNRSDAEATVRKATEAARSLGLDIEIFNARTAGELEPAFRDMADWRADAVLVGPDPLLASLRKRISALAMQHRLPSSGFGYSFVAAGSLMHYGPFNGDNYRMAGVYVGRILKGEDPGELPVLQPTKFEMSINLKTARALGIDVPQSILFQAGRVIE